MNPKLRFILSILPMVAAISVAAQPTAPPAPVPGQASSVVETSRVARILAGPGDRRQGFLLRNGTFVTLGPLLAQQIPTSIGRNTSICVAGDEISYNGNKTIEAQRITVAGVSYEDAGLAARTPVDCMPPAAPAPAPARPSVDPRNSVAPAPPPAACGPVAPPPPPTSAASRRNAPALLPPPPGNAATPQPAAADGAPAPPASTTPATPLPQN